MAYGQKAPSCDPLNETENRVGCTDVRQGFFASAIKRNVY